AGAPSSAAPDRHPSSRPWTGSLSAWLPGPCARTESPGFPPARQPIGSSWRQALRPDLESTLGGPRRIPRGAFVRPRSDPLFPPGRTLVCPALVPVGRGSPVGHGGPRSPPRVRGPGPHGQSLAGPPPASASLPEPRSTRLVSEASLAHVRARLPPSRQTPFGAPVRGRHPGGPSRVPPDLSSIPPRTWPPFRPTVPCPPAHGRGARARPVSSHTPVPIRPFVPSDLRIPRRLPRSCRPVPLFPLPPPSRACRAPSRVSS